MNSAVDEKQHEILRWDEERQIMRGKAPLKILSVHSQQLRLQSIQCHARLISGGSVITDLKKPILIL
jgi:hypothetical protein